MTTTTRERVRRHVLGTKPEADTYLTLDEYKKARDWQADDFRWSMKRMRDGQAVRFGHVYYNIEVVIL
jgi:hypothetical protein